MTPKEIKVLLEERASMYMKSDGSPGPMSTIWGWRAIAREIRNVVSLIEPQLCKNCERKDKEIELLKRDLITLKGGMFIMEEKIKKSETKGNRGKPTDPPHLEDPEWHEGD